MGRAMHSYEMLADGDRILIGVSGGVDSLVLCWTLKHWLAKAPIDCQLLAVHLDMGFEGNEYLEVEKQVSAIPLAYYMEKTTFGSDAFKKSEQESGCYSCSKQRRNRLFSLAAEKNCNKVALGHHKDDIIETFFINMFYGGNLSTMIPNQKLFNGNLAIIRPLAYLTKEQVYEIAALANLTPVKNPCPMADDSKRQEVRTMLTDLFEKHPEFRSTIFASLANVRPDYLLSSNS